MMDFATLLPLLLTGAGTGLTCGVSCGACGNPVMNGFLAGYLFTHTDRLKKSLTAFAGYHMGRAVTVSLLCLMISQFGSRIVDDTGNLFGFNLHRIVYGLMLIFTAILIVRWFMENSGCSGTCSDRCRRISDRRFVPMLLYGAISGMSPCASLMVVLSYASALTAGEAVLVGLSFSLANSVIPLILLTALTGLLSEQMHREIPGKIRYLQLAVYIVFACVLIKNLLSAI